jgi:hypothetical protein
MTDDNESSLHRLEQKQIDKHIFITGFPVKPDEDEVLDSLVSLYDISRDEIDIIMRRPNL